MYGHRCDQPADQRMGHGTRDTGHGRPAFCRSACLAGDSVELHVIVTRRAEVGLKCTGITVYCCTGGFCAY